MSTDESLSRIRAGNARFRAQRAEDEERWATLVEGQRPHAIVLTCADSRVAPEIVFDARPGELFVVRVAGNIANTASIASIEFGVAQLGSRLVVVMAHESCGAVAAALEGGEAGRNLDHLLSHIQAAVDQEDSDDPDAVARANARLTAARLVEESEILRAAVAQDGLRIVPAFFDFSTGEVEFV